MFILLITAAPFQPWKGDFFLTRNDSDRSDGKGNEMRSQGSDKRNSGRMKRELVVRVKTIQETKQAYTIDLSHGGVKVGGALLHLPVGEQVEVFLEKAGETNPFVGRVAREDGMYHINRIGRDANAFFIRIADVRFSEFIRRNYQI